jgi:hypothetical protein
MPSAWIFADVFVFLQKSFSDSGLSLASESIQIDKYSSKSYSDSDALDVQELVGKEKRGLRHWNGTEWVPVRLRVWNADLDEWADPAISYWDDEWK